jgi:hypothetical protein
MLIVLDRRMVRSFDVSSFGGRNFKTMGEAEVFAEHKVTVLGAGFIKLVKGEVVVVKNAVLVVTDVVKVNNVVVGVFWVPVETNDIHGYSNVDVVREWLGSGLNKLVSGVRVLPDSFTDFVL